MPLTFTNLRALLVLSIALLPVNVVTASPVVVQIEDPFIEMRTGPGRGYPMFHVIESGETVTVIRRRTDWFEIQSHRGTKGWVERHQLEKTLDLEGRAIRAEYSHFDSYSQRRWEMGFMSGDFGGADLISVYAAYSLSPHLSVELNVGQGIGSFSDNFVASASLSHQFFPAQRLTPFFVLGTGVIRTSPNATLVETEDRTDQVAYAGGGLRVYAARRLLLRAEYKSYVAFTSRDDNQEVDEWRVGFSFFF
ncbi:MAG: SH3 domain-containing protein [Gammaproteobacteria bacterium]|nr:SH3 domain-containing protein [Gammaproteobacteria bacterium]